MIWRLRRPWRRIITTEWIITPGLTPYEDALAFMEERVAGIQEGTVPECIWLLEHPPLYTAGTSAKAGDLLDARFPVFKTGRGGEYTYHGPGQRVVYVMIDLKRHQQKLDVRAYVCALERWVIAALAPLEIKGERRDGRIGVWVETPAGEKKIAAVGVRIKRWVTMHGIAINICPDLSHFSGIVPCGIKEYGVTSVTEMLGRDVGVGVTDEGLRVNITL